MGIIHPNDHDEPYKERRIHPPGTTARDVSKNSPSQEYSFGSRLAASSVAEPRDQHEFPEAEKNLDEVAALSPIFDPSEKRVREHGFLEDGRSPNPKETDPSQSGSWQSSGPTSSPLSQSIDRRMSGGISEERSEKQVDPFSEFLTKLYTISYLIFFSSVGTLARLAIEALTFYPGAPVTTSVLWANVSGSFIMGFLSEDRGLFRSDKGQVGGPVAETEHDVLWKEHEKAHKKTVPLYVGLSTGFCGCLTSFSTFMRDAFFAISNDVPSPVGSISDISLFHTVSQEDTKAPNGGYSFMSAAAVLITEIGLSLAALFMGAHVALLLAPWMPTISPRFLQKFLDPLVVILASLSWAVTICLVARLPHYEAQSTLWSAEIWRGPWLFALVFAPVGCLMRFFISLKLNGRISSFPLGTFVVNVGGTMILGMIFSLQHAPINSPLGGGGYIACQVQQGIMDGFCGCVTTVSTWVLELSDLRRLRAYTYGILSISIALAMLVVEIGSLRWTRGFATPACFA